MFISTFSNATGVNLLLGASRLLTATSDSRRCSGTLTLAAGQLIGFNLNNAGNYSSDSTGLRFTVTQLSDLDRRELKCACVGGDSNVPLGFLSLIENLVRVAMAIWMAAAPAWLSLAH